MRNLRTIFLAALALGAAALFVRLGFWQLDRLATRRAFNQSVLAQQELPALDLNAAGTALDFSGMAYRAVDVTGVYLFDQEIALRNQQYFGTPGYRLFTPLAIDGKDQYVLVDRGFVPDMDYEPGRWETFSEDPAASVHGVIRLSEAAPDFGVRSDPTPAPGERLLVWNLANVEQISNQMPFDLLPFFVQESPDGPQVEFPDSYPVRTAPEIELTEGPHMSYAIQWFAFAGVVIVGLPFLLYRERQRDR